MKDQGSDMSKTLSSACTVLLLSLCFAVQAFAQRTQVANALPRYFNGITLESPLDLNDQQREKIKALTTPVVIRVVFNRDTPPERYIPVLQELLAIPFPDNPKRKVYLMGELLDSDFLARYRWVCDGVPGCTADENPDSKFHDYQTRIISYLDVLDKYVDIWEVGNEVNGEWADEGCVKDSEDKCKYKEVDGKRVSVITARPDLTAKKIKFAIDKVKVKGKPVALTLIHQPECTTWDDNTMFEWAENNLKPELGDTLINYLLISYYEDNCDKGKLTIDKEPRRLPDQNRRNLYWNRIFNQLAGLFPKVEYIGFGEIGYSSDMETCRRDKLLFCKEGTNKVRGSKIALLNRYHGMQIYSPKYVGGHFWWTAQEDIIYDGFYSVLKSHFKSTE
jgi:hypothetical protein